MDVAFTVRSHSYSSPLLFVYSCMALRRDLIDVTNPDSSSNPYAPRFDLADATDADHSRVLPVSRTGDVRRGARICRRHRVLCRAHNHVLYHSSASHDYRCGLPLPIFYYSHQSLHLAMQRRVVYPRVRVLSHG